MQKQEKGLKMKLGMTEVKINSKQCSNRHLSPYKGRTIVLLIKLKSQKLPLLVMKREIYFYRYIFTNLQNSLPASD